MRTRAWLAWGILLLGIALFAAGNMARTSALDAVGALVVLLALGLGLSLLAFWRRFLPPLPPMPDLMVRPGPGERWCAACGRPAPRHARCVSCGSVSRKQRRKERGLHKKQRARPQEKKA